MKLLDPEVYTLKCGAEAARGKLYRERKKAGLVTPRDVPNSTPESSTPVVSTSTSTNDDSSSSSFSTKQARNRSIFRNENAFPRSPGKRKEVVAKLAKKFDLQIELLPKKMKNGP